MTTPLDRYIGLADRAVHDSSALDEIVMLFASNATVAIGPEPVRGRDAIAAFYRAHFATFTDSKHYWNTTVLEDGTVKAHWVAAARMANDDVITVAGVEHAVIGPDGLIADLRNEFIRLPG